MDIIAIIHKEVSRAAMKAGNSIRRAILSSCSTDYVCAAKGPGDEPFVDVELWQQYGFASMPPAGGEVLMALPGAMGEGAIIVATQDRAHRPTPAADDVIVHGKKGTGQPEIRIKGTNGAIVITGAGATPATVTVWASGAIDVVPGTGAQVNVGSAAPVTDFMLLGTTFDAANRVLITAFNVGFTAIGVGFAAVGTVVTAIANEPHVIANWAFATKTALNTAVMAMGTAVTACTAAATACSTFLAGGYLSTKAKVA